ncbi:M20 family metallo-hydrolase [Bacillus litorisediminis]|uniref:M20 family metallo-hydrolase n=1 Tax=Bacillus litorisediminis TaxID=2922713 RepID=UPI001FB01356|nr:M20 family metallo-hydrolase [Bacillus litorisediminis]
MVCISRIEKQLLELAEIGKISESGVSRLAHSPEDREAINLVETWMIDAGMSVTIDSFSNVIGVYPGKNPQLPPVVIGSHIDTQPYAGRFDGTIGVLGAIEVIRLLKEKNIQPNRTIEVVAFSDEEGCRFNKGLFGVRGLTGKLEENELDRKDQNGITRKEALERIGIEVNRTQEPRYMPENVCAFIEMHIEQGPILESKDLPVGIVSGISGPLWLTVEFKGHSGHAGAVPMNLRQDALVGASRVIYLFDEMLKDNPDHPTVGTAGHIVNFPNSRNTISEHVTFTVDLRDIDPKRRSHYEKTLYNLIESTAEKYNLDYSITEDTNSHPKYCADWIKAIMAEELAKMGHQPFELMSGPFHDSLIMADCCPYGMIFVRCKDGISHHPKEFASMEDIAIGTELLYRTVLRIAAKNEILEGSQ